MTKFNIPKLMFIFTVVISIAACNKTSPNTDWNLEFAKHGAMGDAYVKMGSRKCLGECQWTRLSPTELRFDGVIEPKSYDEFINKIDDDVRVIILNSGGGYVEVGLKIAAEMKRRNLNVIVRGFCVSSCANYLFLAGQKKTIDGIVGFHGNVQAMKRAECKENIEIKDVKYCEEFTFEKSFFESIGMSNFLFDVTQSDDKGMQTDLQYAYYAPSARTLKALGVNDVEGDQRVDFLFELKKLHDKFGDVDFRIATDPNPTILARFKQKI